MTTTIKPTNTCFDDALDFFDDLARSGAGFEDMVDRYRVVHGICLMPQSDRPYAHAWVEDRTRDLVLQRGILNGKIVQLEMSVLEFTLRHRPQKFTRYTLREALRLNYESNHYGPWVEEYRALCRDEPPPNEPPQIDVILGIARLR